MRQTSVGEGAITLSSSSAFAICDGLLRMAHCLIVELPEPELRDIYYTLGTLLAKTEQVLEVLENDVFLNFDNLSLDPETWAEDFGAVFVSTTVTTESSEPTSSTSSRRRGNTISRATAPAPPASPTLAPESPAQTHGRYPLVISSRESVGFPDYTHHPQFVRPGTPGAYQRPPTANGLAGNTPWFVISKGLYVGIFSDWNEVAPWVIGVSGSLFRKVRSWAEAKDIYNGRLASGTTQILS